MYTIYNGYYTMNDIESFIEDANDFDVIEKNGVLYANCPASFDIETSSFYENGIKRGVMYIWQFGLNGRVIIGRTWEEFYTLLDALAAFHALGVDARFIIYVHNLPYEFSWLMRRMEWTDIFFKDSRKPLYAVTDGFIFKCSYALSNMSLESVGKNLVKYPVEKLKGFLDYTKVRTPVTPLTEKELQYCVNDAQVVMSYIQEKIETDGDILHIPMTNTSYVRNFCRAKTLYREDKGKQNRFNKKYRDLIKSLKLTSEIYEMSRACFQGGFTHANARKTGKTIENVHSVDFTSSYPYVMTTMTFPMSTPKLIENVSYADLDDLMKKYHLMFEIAFENIMPADDIQEHYISKSKCMVCKGDYDETGNLIEDVIIDNGRVVWAKYLVTSITDVDMRIIRRYYKWDNVKIRNVYKMIKSRLPKEFISAILELYANKTKLKGVDGKEVEYLVSKGMCNSSYGMSVTNPLNDIIEFDLTMNEIYRKSPCDVEKELEKYNKSKKRFLYYPWGVFVTAWARYNLCMSIPVFGDDYIYSDTDSIKFTNIEKHFNFIEAYNANVKKTIIKTCKELNLSEEIFKPKTIAGVEKPLGVWEWETKKESYAKFKTLGAKRYLYQQSDGLHLTVSGVNKKSGAKYLESFTNPFDAFTNALEIPKGHSGRIISTYIDEPIHGYVVDLNGELYEYDEKSAVHMEETSYIFDISRQYLNYCAGLREEIS